MRKKMCFILMCCAVFFFLFGPKPMSAGEFVFFINGNYSGGVSIGDTVYTRSKTFSDIIGTYVTINDNGDILASMPSGLYGASAGFSYFFTKELGISLSATYLKKAEVDIVASYKLDWTWVSRPGTVYNRQASWEDVGSFSVIPISLNLIYRAALGQSTFFSISAGPSIFLTKVELNSRAGFGDAESFAIGWWIYRYIEWFEMDVFVNQKETIIGGNVGLDFEQKIAGNFGIFIGFKYFIAPTKTYLWELDQPSKYYGKLKNYDWTPTATSGPNIDHFPTFELKISHWRIVAGFKIHLGGQQKDYQY